MTIPASAHYLLLGEGQGKTKVKVKVKVKVKMNVKVKVNMCAHFQGRSNLLFIGFLSMLMFFMLISYIFPGIHFT